MILVAGLIWHRKRFVYHHVRYRRVWKDLIKVELMVMLVLGLERRDLVRVRGMLG